MRHAAVKAVGVVLFATVCLAQPADVRQFEQQRAEAERTGAGLGRFYAADYWGIRGDGVKTDLNTLLTEKADPGFAVTDLDVRAYGDGAVAVGTQRVGAGLAVRFLRVWVKQAGEWKLVAFQGTNVVADAGYTGAPSSIVATPHATPTGRPDHTVLAAENALVMHDGHNEEARALVTDDFIFVSHAGTSAAAYREPKSVPLKNVITSWDRVQSYGDIAVVQGTLLWTDLNAYTPGQLRFTRVWLKQDGEWKLAAEQRTPIGSPR